MTKATRKEGSVRGPGEDVKTRRRDLATDQTPLRTRLLKTLSRFVAIQTVSRPPDEDRPPGEKCDYEEFGKALKEEAEARGLVFERIGKHEGNYLVKRKDESPDKKKMILVTHCDVVPIEDIAKWEEAGREPFEVTVDEDDDKVHGRGVADDKSHIVIALEAMSELAGADVDVRLIVGRDEELGSELGYEYLAEEGHLDGYASALVLDAGPNIVTAASGGVWANLDSVKHPTAIYDALMRYKERRRRTTCDYDAVYEEPGTKLFGRLSITVIDATFESNSRIRAIKGGSKTNLIPERCEIEFDPKAEGMIRERLGEGFTLDVKEPGKAEIVGKSGHAGYEHIAKNPVEEALRITSLIGHGTVKSCSMQSDIRTLPGEKGEDIARVVNAALNVADPQATRDVKPVVESSTLPESDETTRVLNAVISAFGANGLPTRQIGEFGGLDACLLIAKGIPAISFGVEGIDTGFHTDHENASLELMETIIKVVSHVARNYEADSR